MNEREVKRKYRLLLLSEVRTSSLSGPSCSISSLSLNLRYTTSATFVPLSPKTRARYHVLFSIQNTSTMSSLRYAICSARFFGRLLLLLPCFVDEDDEDDDEEDEDEEDEDDDDEDDDDEDDDDDEAYREYEDV